MNASIKRERIKPSSSSLRTTASSNYNFATRLKNRVCSNSCLKIVYLSCATLISASFIIECILLHLIIVPYLSESIFEEGMCQYSASRREESSKRCENKCSKERSTFPCLQIIVKFTPIRTVPYQVLKQKTNNNINKNKELMKQYMEHENYEKSLTPMLSNTASDLSNFTKYYDSTESRMVYLYDYFSTFAAHKTSQCSTSPCHRREEDNKLAVEEFKRDLSRRHIFHCYARPKTPMTSTQIANIQTTSQHSVSSSSSSSFPSLPSSTSSSSSTSPPSSSYIYYNLNDSKISSRYLPLISSDPKDAAAILHRLYTPSMFMHSLLWPGGIFLTALLILLFTYFTDSCEAWAGDKTVIA
uniref:Calcium activated potassium channel subunit n=1 Tax=Trichobilharzia regenti TaxID=157069 RepID=A0AA85JI00_TRIRE|nr:unnamed protein product [Trichobilharzia regenti]